MEMAIGVGMDAKVDVDTDTDRQLAWRKNGTQMMPFFRHPRTQRVPSGRIRNIRIGDGMKINAQLSSGLVKIIERTQPSVVEVVSEERGVGAGVIWRADGAILTNHHVVAGKRGIKIRLPDGRAFDAKVINSNSRLDLALLEVNAKGLPAVLVDDSSKLRVGELVLAIGHPWGQRHFVTAGIVSGLGSVKVASDGQTAQYIRSDVRLAPGNSGGPLLNARGAVVGINAMIFGGDLSVAIPSHVASKWVAGLPSRRVSLGVGLQLVELPATLRQGAWAERAAGLMVTAIPANHHTSPTLLVGDVLLDVAGEPVQDVDTLSHTLGRHDISDQVRLHIMRGGRIQQLDVQVSGLERVVSGATDF
ncbi:MAG: S1C family serine protease [Ardenticatenaceae bacterium]